MCAALPKAHLHLHFTGSMRPATLLELADKYGVHLPEALTRRRAARSCGPPTSAAGSASSGCTTSRAPACATPEDIQRLVREAAEEDVAGRLGLAGDPGRPDVVRARGWAG